MMGKKHYEHVRGPRDTTAPTNDEIDPNPPSNAAARVKSHPALLRVLGVLLALHLLIR